MEEKIRMRPSTPRTVGPKPDDFSDLVSPEMELASLAGLNPSALANLLKLDLQLNSEEVAVHKFGSCCPQLKELKLSNSSIESLRSLGTEWRNLEILWLVRTGLLEIDGISAFPKLNELYCAFNSISNLSALMFHEAIQVLDIEANKIEDWSEVESLQYCSNLYSVNFEGNPISKSLDYREKVFAILPQLNVLDDLSKEAQIEIKIEESEELDIIRNSVRESVIIRNKSQMSTRPSTAANIFQEESSHLTEEVFSGNPIKAMRFRRKKMFGGEGKEDLMKLIKEFKFEIPKSECPTVQRPVVVKNKNIKIRSVRKDEFYETH